MRPLVLGGIVTLVAVGLFFWWLGESQPERRTTIRRFGVAVVISVAVVWLLVMNWVLTL